jgi:ribosomal-protein-alanine N-acetyltransferase
MRVNRTVGWVKHGETHHGLMVNGESIRPFRGEDIDDIMEIERRAFPKSPYPKALILEYARKYPEGFMVLQTGRAVAGYLIYDQREGHVFSMAVKPSRRRKGLGTRLFMHARTHAKGKLWLEVRSKNRSALHFYESLGMRIRGKIPGYYEQDDAFIMVLEVGGGAGEVSMAP